MDKDEPIFFSDVELEALLHSPESDLIERKDSWKGDAPEKARQAVCAFANDLPGHRKPGVLIVGMRDDGSPSGIQVDDGLLRTLADLKTDGKIVPPPTISVARKQIQGGDVAVVQVLPADAPPVKYEGRIWIRIGARRGIASAQDERILNERRRNRDRPFDVQPLPSADLSVLSRVSFEQEYLPLAFAADVLAANDRTVEQQLAACKMIAGADYPIPTVLGVLVLGKSPRDWIPGAWVQFLRIAGGSLSDSIVDSAEIDGPIVQILRGVDEKLNAHLSVGVDLVSQSTEIRDRPYPLAALQQIVRNAIMHRTYEGTYAPVRVSWFDDRIEILSPGGPFGTVTRENFGRPGVTDYRNPNLAEAMKVLGFVQRFGVGIATAQRELQKNGNPLAEFVVEPNHVLAVIRNKR